MKKRKTIKTSSKLFGGKKVLPPIKGFLRIAREGWIIDVNETKTIRITIRPLTHKEKEEENTSMQGSKQDIYLEIVSITADKTQQSEQKAMRRDSQQCLQERPRKEALDRHPFLQDSLHCCEIVIIIVDPVRIIERWWRRVQVRNPVFCHKNGTRIVSRMHKLWVKKEEKQARKETERENWNCQ